MSQPIATTQIGTLRLALRKLRIEDDTGNFECGVKALDEYIWYQAKDQQSVGASKV